MRYRIRWRTHGRDRAEADDGVGKLLVEARPSPEILPAARSRAMLAYAMAEARRQGQQQARRRGTAWALCTAIVLAIAAVVHVGRDAEVMSFPDRRIAGKGAAGWWNGMLGERLRNLPGTSDSANQLDHTGTRERPLRHRHRRHRHHHRAPAPSVTPDRLVTPPLEVEKIDQVALNAGTTTPPPPASRLIVMITDAPPPLKVTVTDAASDAPGYACASASDLDERGGIVRRQCAIELTEHHQEAKQITLARLDTGTLPTLLTIQTTSDTDPTQKGDKQ